MSELDHCERTGKIAYKNRSKANKARAEMSKRHSFKGSSAYRLESFECRACGHWHLGNTLANKPKPKTDWHPAP